jgi:hypothetical protein
MVWDRNEKMMVENARSGEAEYGCRPAREKEETTPLRNEAQLNCVSLRSELDCEVTWGAVKGQDERPLSAAPLTARQVTTGGQLKKTIKTAATSALTFMTFS